MVKRKLKTKMQRLLYVAMIAFLSMPCVQAQQRGGIAISGKVTDGLEALSGVTVAVRGTSTGASTDDNGEFKLTVPSDTCVLIISYVGFLPQQITVGKQRIFVVTLAEDKQQLEEVVVIGFGKQKKTDVIGAVTTINVKEIKKVSSSNITTMMAGNIAGMISYQRSGEPGRDNADFFIRGVTTFGYKKDPLILIDGIESTTTDLARMQPDDIENFSIMKDATSTAVYGARGANGVISITTKEGAEGKLSISARIEEAMTAPTRKIELADPITYMRLNNEAVLTRNALGMTPYTQSKIDNTIAGTNPLAYPVTDWYNELISDRAHVQRVNLNASGGGKIARYYLAATFNQDNGNLKVDNRNNYNNNISLSTYSFRSNINFTMTASTKASLKMAAVFDDYTGPISGGSDVYWQVMHSNPVLFPAYYAPDENNMLTKHILFGNYGSGSASYINPYAEMVKGYKDYTSSKIDAQFEVEQDLSRFVDGLSLRALFQTSRYSYFDVSRFYNPYYYMLDVYDPVTNKYTLLQLNEGTEYLGYTEGTKTVNSTNYVEIMANYSHLFDEVHQVNGMLVYILRNYIEGNAGDIQLSLPHRNLGLSGRATYSYKSKYYGEFNFGYNGSERFHKSHRFGFFPSFGAAWTVSNEDFWTFSNVNNLKFRATYGLVGNDAIGEDNDRFFYLSNINMSAGGYSFGTANASGQSTLGSTQGITGVSIIRNANNEITWEIAKKLNIGFELGLWGDFVMEADYFNEHRTNILMSRTSIPTTMGLTTTERANVGEARAYGVDGSINYTKSFSNRMWLTGRANYTFATSEFLVYEEPRYKEAYRSRIGYSLSQQWGLIAERLFLDEEEVSNTPSQGFGEYLAGDIKYRDVNGDGLITDADAVPIGYPTDPEIIYGFGLSGGWKGFDVSCFFQGSARSSFWIDATQTSPFYDNRTYHSGTINNTQMLKVYADSHWSEDNRDLYAVWPRLSTTTISNNTQRSTWFMQDGTFLRLKSLEMGYTLPLKLMDKLGLSNARFYLNGTNLFCWSKFKLWDVEMGGNGLGYPIQKSYTVGLNISF